MVESFINDAEKIQGKMKLSNWKGSVLDSVMAAYLTQNVSDTLSSSVFMGLINKYPNRPSAADRVKLEKRSCTLKNKPVDTQCPDLKRRKQKKGETIDWCRLKNKYCKRACTKKQGDSLDWEAVRKATLKDFAHTIKDRGQQYNIAERMQNCLNILVNDLGSTDLEWMRHVPTNEARKHLLSMRGLGQKSVECILLLGLKQKAFPIDTHAGRVFVRLGWVPMHGIEQEKLHLLEEYPGADYVQKYLWPRLCQLKVPELYELHCQVITLGKVFCTKINPNCEACPMKAGCRHNNPLGGDVILGNPKALCESSRVDKQNSHSEWDIEDFGRLEIVPFSTSKRKSVSVANTKQHEVYVLPDSHPFLSALPKINREDPMNDRCHYLLATWTKDEECKSEEAVVDGTLLIPIPTALKGNFPFAATYFQPNQVFADYDSSENPIQVARASLTLLRDRATLHCGNVAPIYRGMESQEVQECFQEGYICSRSVDIETMGTHFLHPRFCNPERKKKVEKLRNKKMKLE